MPPRRRYTVYLGLAVILLLAFATYRDPLVTTARVRYGALFPSATKNEDGHFRWSSVPIDYPVKSLTALPTGAPLALPKVQFKFSAETGEEAKKRKGRQAAVKSAFRECWNSYKEVAWMQDEVSSANGETDSEYRFTKSSPG